MHTVNSDIFVRVQFSWNFAYAKFRENRTLANCGYHSVVNWYRQIMLCSRFFTLQMCLLTLFAKNSEFTVPVFLYQRLLHFVFLLEILQVVPLLYVPLRPAVVPLKQRFKHNTLHLRFLGQASGEECVTKNDFLIFQPKHMLWVLKRTVSMRRFF